MRNMKTKYPLVITFANEANPPSKGSALECVEEEGCSSLETKGK